MVECITGAKGTRKTGLLVDRAIEFSQDDSKRIVFVDCSDSLECVLPSNIRFINSVDYDITSAQILFGFLSGICASDFDITDIFVDSTLRIINNNTTNIDDFVSLMNEVSKKTGVKFHFAYCDEYAPVLLDEQIR